MANDVLEMTPFSTNATGTPTAAADPVRSATELVQPSQSEAAESVQGYSLDHLENPKVKEKDRSIPPYRALFLFAPTNRIRQTVHRFTTWPWFDNLVLFAIVASSILIAAEDTANPSAPRNAILVYFDYIFLGFFVLEMVLKWVALGVVAHPRSYLRDPWNAFDFLVVTSSLVSVSLAALGVDASFVRVLRVFRVLRPLRSIQRLPKLKEVVVCFIASVVNISGIAVLFLLFMFLFSVMGVQLFKGGFYSCNDPSVVQQSACAGTFTVANQLTGLPEQVDRAWEDAFFNFNNVGDGLNTLFATATGEGWPGTLYRAIDASTAEGGSPVYNNRPAAGLFFICYMLLVSFALLNLFVGFVVVTFRETAERSYESCPMNKNQRKCMEYALQQTPQQRHRWMHPVAPVRWLRAVVTSQAFEVFIFVVIVLNVVALTLPYYGMSEQYGDVLNWVNVAFVSHYLSL